MISQFGAELSTTSTAGWLASCVMAPAQRPGQDLGGAAGRLENLLVHRSHGGRDGSEGIAWHVELSQGRNIADR